MCLLGGCCHAGKRLPVGGVAVAAEIASNADFGMPRNGEIGFNDHAATAIQFAVGDGGELVPKL